ncbi:hypothetical protein [Prescottella subtropica]|uniref:hypothetical protein n=1 Tax=Prescottella subtropica TaxID=2545757 RepID=UPI0010F66FE6|nr:hypothetical protein [Prescottella subtropica]
MIDDAPPYDPATGVTAAELRGARARFTAEDIARVTDIEWRGRAIGGDFDSAHDRQLWQRWCRYVRDQRAGGWQHLLGCVMTAAASIALVAVAAAAGREWLLSLIP